MLTYSAFFSSGLLAPHRSYNSTNDAAYPYYDAPSPAAPSFPLPLDDDSDIEIDRSITPTGPPATSNTNMMVTEIPAPSTTSAAAPPNRPHLRKRRSSLTVATSPMNSIKSPTRTAGAALQLQRHLSPSRARSGSLNINLNASVVTGDLFGGAYGGLGVGNIASEGTSLVGRMRSGSVGGPRYVPTFLPYPHLSLH